MRKIDIVESSRHGERFKRFSDTRSCLYKQSIDRVVDHAVPVNVWSHSIVVRNKESIGL